MGSFFTCCFCPKDDDDEETVKPPDSREGKGRTSTGAGTNRPTTNSTDVTQKHPRLSSKSSMTSSVASQDSVSVKKTAGYHESTPLLKEPRTSSSTEDATKPSKKSTALKKVEKVVKVSHWTHGKRDKHSTEESTASSYQAPESPKTTSNAVAQSHEAVIERGQNIARTEEASEDMVGHAQSFGETMKALAELQRKKSEKKKHKKRKSKNSSTSGDD